MPPSSKSSGAASPFTDLRFPQLPGRSEPSLPAFPGHAVGDLFVRHTAPESSGATRAVYVHGMGGNSNNWTDLMYLLQPWFPGSAPDLPGYGFSEPSVDGVYSLDRHVRAVATLIESEGGAPVHLFGNSLGGTVVVALAAHRPDLVRSLTLIAPAMFTPATLVREHLPKLWGIVTEHRKARRLGIDRLAQMRADEVIGLCFADRSRLKADRYTEIVREATRRIALPYDQDVATASAMILFRAAGGQGGTTIWDLAARVSAPTLALYGAKDQMVPAHLAAKTAQVFPRAQVTILPDCGHVAQMEHPVTTARLVLNWIASHGG